MRALFLISTVCAKLMVNSPESLKKLFGDEGEIPVQMANFGHMPYGQTLVSIYFFDLKSGKLYYNVTNSDGCDPDNIFT